MSSKRSPNPVREAAAEGLSREARKARTRSRLKRAGRTAFARMGYGATQIADVVREAGVAQGTFYVHFPSKEALLDELVAEFNSSLLVRLGEDGVGTGRPAEPEPVVRRIAAACLDHWAEHRDLVRAFVERASARADLGPVRDGITPEAGRFVRASLAAAFPDLAASETRLSLIVHGLLGMWMRIGLEHLFGERPSRRQTLDTLVGMTLGSLAAVTGPPRGAVRPPTRTNGSRKGPGARNGGGRWRR